MIVYSRLLIGILCLFVSACGLSFSDFIGKDDNAAPEYSFPDNPPPGLYIPDEPLDTLRWVMPQARENGIYLEADEIGGYELRYTPRFGGGAPVSVMIPDPWQTEFSLLPLLTPDMARYYHFHIATFDRDGLYSRFVELEGFMNSAP